MFVWVVGHGLRDDLLEVSAVALLSCLEGFIGLRALGEGASGLLDRCAVFESRVDGSGSSIGFV